MELTTHQHYPCCFHLTSALLFLLQCFFRQAKIKITYTFVHSHTHARVCTYIHTHAHTRTQTHTCTQTHTSHWIHVIRTINTPQQSVWGEEGRVHLTHTHSQRDHTHLGRRDQDAAQSVQPGGDLLMVALHQTGPQPHGPGGQPPGPEVGGILEVEHGQGGAEEVGEVVQQHQAVAQPGHGQTLQVVELHGHRRRQATRAHRLVGGPGQAVGRAACHPVDLLACKGEGKVLGQSCRLQEKYG